MKRFFLWDFLFLAICISFAVAQDADSLSSEISLRTYLEKDSVPLDGEVVYNVELSWHGDLDRFVIKDIEEPTVSNLKVRGSGSANRITRDSNGNPISVRRVTYYFTPIEMGMAYVDGMTVQYHDKVANKDETLVAKRVGLKITEPENRNANSFVPGTLLIWGLPIVFLIVVVIVIIRYLQRRKSVKEAEDQVQVSIEEKYLALLHDTIHISNNDNSGNLVAIIKLFNSYLAEKFSIPGNLDTAIVKDRLVNMDMPEEKIAKIETMYDRAELAKFAAEPVDISEIHMFYDTIESIISIVQNSETAQETSKG